MNLHKCDMSNNASHWLLSVRVCVCVRARGSGSVSVVPSYYPQSLRKNVSAENLQLNYLNKLGSLCVWDLPHKCVLMESFV